MEGFPVGAAWLGWLRQKAFVLGCFLLREPHPDRSSTWLSFWGWRQLGHVRSTSLSVPDGRTDPTEVAGLWFLLSVNPVDMRVGLLPDPLSFLVTVCPPYPACFHSIPTLCLQMEMQARVCGETGSLASAMEREAALESHPLPCLSSTSTLW